MSKTITVDLANYQATKELGKILGYTLPVGSVLLLEGELGTGKTTFVQGLADGLSITDSIDSPTFTLVNEYLGGRIPLYHVDLYRLDPSEILGLNLPMYWEGQELPLGILAIEWANKLPYRPRSHICLRFSYQEPDQRQVEIINFMRANDGS